jgi:hypothetical protein
LDDEVRLWELYKAHKGAMKINKKVDCRILEKRKVQFKEDENDPGLTNDLVMLKGIIGIIWLNEQDKKVLSRITNIIQYNLAGK